jgi:hypothetical protein
MAEQEEEEVEKNKRIRPRERARGQKPWTVLRNKLSEYVMYFALESI